MSDPEAALQALRDEVLELQEKVAFQEDSIESLNAALQAQQADLSVLQRHWELLKDQYQALKSQLDSGDAGEEPPPPHY